MNNYLGEDDSQLDDEGEISAGLIALIVIIVVLVLAAIVACAVLLTRRNQRN